MVSCQDHHINVDTPDQSLDISYPVEKGNARRGFHDQIWHHISSAPKPPTQENDSPNIEFLGRFLTWHQEMDTMSMLMSPELVQPQPNLEYLGI